MTAAKDRLFRRAFERFEPDHLGFERFLQDNAHWLDDYALYMALKEATTAAGPGTSGSPSSSPASPRRSNRLRENAGRVDPLLPVRPVRLRPAVAALRELCAGAATST